MASASSFAEEELVDTQLQKSTPEESAGNAGQMKTETKKKKKKKILLQEPDWYVQDVLSYKPEITETEVPEFIIRKDPVLAASLYIMFANTAQYEEYIKDEMLEKQRNFRHQLRTQGRVTYEVEVDEDDDRFVPADSHAGKGRRRHRPGVMKKQDGQTRKLN